MTKNMRIIPVGDPAERHLPMCPPMGAKAEGACKQSLSLDYETLAQIFTEPGDWIGVVCNMPEHGDDQPHMSRAWAEGSVWDDEERVSHVIWDGE